LRAAPCINRGQFRRLPTHATLNAGASRPRAPPRSFQQRFQRSLKGLCVEVSVPISLPVAVRFSIPVWLDDDGFGLCVELVLPIPSAVEFVPVGPPPLVLWAKDTVLWPAKRTRATKAAPVLQCIARRCEHPQFEGQRADVGCGSLFDVAFRGRVRPTSAGVEFERRLKRRDWRNEVS
jgi:hypothetical protein